ncbi:MAG: GNAT family N-acetyltransferase [Planctomycetaceae bacterium]
MQVRDATLADARRIAEIHVAAWKAAYRGIMPDELLDGLSVDDRERSWREQLRDERQRTCVVLDRETIVGWASCGDCHDDDVPAGTAEVYGIYLDPAWWRRGAGRTLWESVLREAARNGARSLTVRVLEANANASRFYEAMGGVLDPTGRKMICRGGTKMAEVRYRYLVGVRTDDVTRLGKPPTMKQNH